MSMPFTFGRLQKFRMKKGTSPALVLNITERVVNNVLHYDIVIVEQKYRNEKFHHGSNEFIASNSFVLSSVVVQQAHQLMMETTTVCRNCMYEGQTLRVIMTQ